MCRWRTHVPPEKVPNSPVGAVLWSIRTGWEEASQNKRKLMIQSDQCNAAYFPARSLTAHYLLLRAWLLWWLKDRSTACIHVQAANETQFVTTQTVLQDTSTIVPPAAGHFLPEFLHRSIMGVIIGQTEGAGITKGGGSFRSGENRSPCRRSCRAPASVSWWWAVCRGWRRPDGRTDGRAFCHAPPRSEDEDGSC